MSQLNCLSRRVQPLAEQNARAFSSRQKDKYQSCHQRSFFQFWVQRCVESYTLEASEKGSPSIRYHARAMWPCFRMRYVFYCPAVFTKRVPVVQRSTFTCLLFLMSD